jgi:hypothetical protein
VAALDRSTAILAGLGIGVPVGFLLYLLWVATESLSALLYGVVFVLAAGLLIWSGVAIMDRRDKR